MNALSHATPPPAPATPAIDQRIKTAVGSAVAPEPVAIAQWVIRTAASPLTTRFVSR